MAILSKIKVSSTVYDISDKSTHSDLNTTSKTYVGGINELKTSKQNKVYHSQPSSPQDGDIWIDEDDHTGEEIPTTNAGQVEYDGSTTYPSGSVGRELAAIKSKIKSITLSSTWTGSESPYTHSVSITGYTVTSNTKVDIQPDATAIQQLIDDSVVGLYILNNNGTLTAYAIGEKPTDSLTLQVSVSEVAT